MSWRTAQRWKHAKTSNRKVGVGTARRELECLQSAINHYAEEYGIHGIVKITLPRKPEGRDRWLTRQQAAQLLRAAWQNKRHRHLARFILIGLYTGTRHTAILKLRWLPSPDGGWFDLDRGLLYRKGIGAAQTKKRQTPCRIPPRLMPWLRRWKELDEKKSQIHIVSWGGVIKKERRAWARARDAAGLGQEVTPHVLRHTAATWLMQRGVDLWQAGSYLGMDPITLKNVYGRHHPDFQSEAANAFQNRNRQ